jgi:hypothetical protein
LGKVCGRIAICKKPVPILRLRSGQAFLRDKIPGGRIANCKKPVPTFLRDKIPGGRIANCKKPVPTFLRDA